MKGACVLAVHILSKASRWRCCCVRWIHLPFFCCSISQCRAHHHLHTATNQHLSLAASSRCRHWHHHQHVHHWNHISCIELNRCILFSLQRAPVCATSQFSVALTPTDDGYQAFGSAEKQRNGDDTAQQHESTDNFSSHDRLSIYSTQNSAVSILCNLVPKGRADALRSSLVPP